MQEPPQQCTCPNLQCMQEPPQQCTCPNLQCMQEPPQQCTSPNLQCMQEPPQQCTCPNLQCMQEPPQQCTSPNLQCMQEYSLKDADDISCPPQKLKDPCSMLQCNLANAWSQCNLANAWSQCNLANAWSQCNLANAWSQCNLANAWSQCNLANAWSQCNLGNAWSQCNLGNAWSQCNLANAWSQCNLANAWSQCNLANAWSQCNLANAWSQCNLANAWSQCNLGNAWSQCNLGNAWSQCNLGNAWSQCNLGLYELLATLPSQLQPHVDSQEDLTFLWDMFGEKSLHSLVKIHEKLHYYEKENPLPIIHSATALADDLAEELQSKTLNSEIRELLKLLSKPNLKALLSVHDTVAQKSYDPVLPPLPDDIDDDEDSVKIIRLVKNREPLGATIKKDESTGAIVVARIMRGGAADRSGLIHVGDELREVNGITVEDKKPEEIIHILAQSQGAITFKIIPSIKEESPNNEGKIFVKALFDYFPNEDKAIPCKEAGLMFQKGDTLQIMSQDDATWWQAKHEGDANPRAGLIPSKQFQERRFALKKPVVLTQPPKVPNRKSYEETVEYEDIEEDTEYAATNTGTYLAGFRRSFRLSKKDRKTNKFMYECKKSDQYDTADVPTYEEVALYQRPANEKYRLIVLVGPVGVGLNELKRKVLISDTQHYGVTVPHTTRGRRNQECDGVEYIFISKHLFETDIHNNKFIEYGEYKNNYYGTSIDSIRSVLTKNKVCLLDVQPHSLKHLRTSEFKPFIIFIKPPSIERLRETRKNGKVISGKEERASSKAFTEEDFDEMIKSAQVMETQYGHLFDKVITNDDLTTAYNELKLTLDRLESERCWVPVNWLHS
ncbi:MAGUK p55 subfamily member 7 [Pelodytes ibericus]